MNLFDVYPQLNREQTRLLKNRALRLIALSGLVYDTQAFYFELGDSRFWGHLPDGSVVIGVGAAKVQPDATHPPHRALVRHLRRHWQCDVALFSTGHTYILGEDNQVAVLQDVDAATPYVFILTAPQLGGSEMPDALVQALYLLPLRHWRGKAGAPGTSRALLRIQHEALGRFLEPVDWALDVLLEQPWAMLHNADAGTTPLPDVVRLRPVLVLRGLQDLLHAGALPLPLRAT
ncbi:MAG: hypothetical protein JXA21_22875 [Anaerolineae bacterium]|nr:hypothetical protein [Anaerolineae bacterium]